MDIRPYQPRDLPALYRICLETGASGSDATGFFRDPLLLGHLFAAPYAVLAPECCLVVDDEDGVGGYIVGARDTPEFERRLTTEWWPDLRSLYPLQGDARERTQDLRLVAYIHNPPQTPPSISRAFPSHLHINLLSRLQGIGVGRRLIDTWLDAMRAMASCGAHLATGEANARAVRFYRRFGFTELERSGRNGSVVWFGVPLGG